MQRKKGFMAADRYVFDFNLCNCKDGWAQLDTDQDASYFGNWVHPEKFEFVSYTEGDVCRVICDDKDEFKEELKKVMKWHDDNGYNPRIDTMSNKQPWRDLGYEVKNGLVVI